MKKNTPLSWKNYQFSLTLGPAGGDYLVIFIMSLKYWQLSSGQSQLFLIM